MLNKTKLNKKIILSLKKIKPVHIFYKGLPTNENNISTADIAEYEVENVKFKKSQEYAITGLSINHDIRLALVAVTDIDRQIFLSSTIQKPVKEKKDLDFDLKIYNEEMALDNIIPFQKNTN